MTSNSWLDFGGDPNHDVDTGYLMDYLPLGIQQFYKFWK